MHTVTAEQWVGELRSHLGTPFKHQGRSINGGLDCVGLLSVSGLSLGIGRGSEKVRGYAHTPDSGLFEIWCEQFMDRLPYNRLQALTPQMRLGDVMTFWIDTQDVPRHVAVYTGEDAHGNATMIHSYANGKKGVIEHVIDMGYWKHRLNSLFRVRELRN